MPSIREAVGRRIQELRTGAKLSQAELAKLVGGRLSGHQIYLYERGKRLATIERLDRIAVALGVSIAELFSAMPLRHTPEALRAAAMVDAAMAKDKAAGRRAIAVLKATLLP